MPTPSQGVPYHPARPTPRSPATNQTFSSQAQSSCWPSRRSARPRPRPRRKPRRPRRHLPAAARRRRCPSWALAARRRRTAARAAPAAARRGPRERFESRRVRPSVHAYLMCRTAVCLSSFCTESCRPTSSRHAHARTMRWCCPA